VRLGRGGDGNNENDEHNVREEEEECTEVWQFVQVEDVGNQGIGIDELENEEHLPTLNDKVGVESRCETEYCLTRNDTDCGDDYDPFEQRQPADNKGPRMTLATVPVLDSLAVLQRARHDRTPDILPTRGGVRRRQLGNGENNKSVDE
jgi:hypothetical protein